jgi:succinate dehydrogenase / fumarate reductase, membrane anchor subunit
MVGQVNRRGFHEWVVQRVTAVVIAIYAIFIIAYLLSNSPLYYAQWHGLFSNVWFKIASFLVLISILWHAWLGIWTVFTDYVKPVALRYVLEILVIILLLGYLAWGIEILWHLVN